VTVQAGERGLHVLPFTQPLLHPQHLDLNIWGVVQRVHERERERERER
jgi:hypothetical protein